MKLNVKNFGPIKEGEIDLSKRFYVFVGHNNSGKTYMANLVWSFFDWRVTRGFFKHNYDVDFYTKVIDKEIDNGIQIEVKEFLKYGLTFYNAFLRSYFPQVLNISKEHFLLKETFFEAKTSVQHIIPPNFKYLFTLGNNIYLLKSLSISNLELEILKKTDSISILALNNSYKKLKELGYDSYYRTPRNFSYKEALNHIAIIFTFNLIIGINETFFLPANRIFYPSFYKYVYDIAKLEKDKIDQKLNNGNTDLNGLKALSKRPYTKPMDRLLEEIYNLNKNVKPTNFYTPLLQKIEKLIGGKIITKSSEGIAPIEFYLQMDNGEELDMYLSSSAANQLTTLYLYLKYWAMPSNNFLIIDEPEENLHPQNQTALLDILMQFANMNNNRVLITTHSSLMTDAVNNYVHIAYLKDKGKDVKSIIEENNLDISINEHLKQEDFGVYFFGNGTITPYEASEYGVFFKDFAQEEDRVKDIAYTLKDHIYQLRKEKTSTSTVS